MVFFFAGVVSSDHEDEAEGPEEEANGQIPWRRRLRLRRSGEVRRAPVMAEHPGDFPRISGFRMPNVTEICLG